MNTSIPCPPLRLTYRKHDSHKGDYGRVLMVGGSRGMAGAISLSAMAALRTGSGLVSAFVPDRCLDTVAGFDPCLMTIAAPDNDDGHFSQDATAVLKIHSAKANAIGIGPGMGTGAGAASLVAMICKLQSIPRVFDADALNLISRSGPHAAETRLLGPAVLTPHPGEMERLTGSKATDRLSQIEAAVSFALSHDVVLLLKGAQTFVTDGKERWFNETGNPGMAKGGSGDCLTGIITSLLGQGIPPCPAAKLGAFLHGRAGDLAAAAMGESGMTPMDLLHFLPVALRESTGK